MEKYQIFISYRRDGGEGLAGRISDRFSDMGYSVFFDVESMRSGKFNEQILKAIDSCSDVLVVLPKGGLDRCADAGDWVRREIAHAIKQGKNIIPIMMRGFEFPDSLSEDIDDIRHMQGVSADMEYFDAVLKKIEKLLSCRRTKTVEPKRKASCDTEIKLPPFLATPGFKLKDKLERLFGASASVKAGKEMWNFVCGVYDYDELDKTRFKDLHEKLTSIVEIEISPRHSALFDDVPMAALPYISYGRAMDEIVDKHKFNVWAKYYLMCRKSIAYITKRYNTAIDVSELATQISDLTYRKLYGAENGDCSFFVFELMLLLTELMEVPKRGIDFSFLVFCEYLLNCCMSGGMIRADKSKKKIVKKMLGRVSYMIECSAAQTGMYENSDEVFNTRLEIFLKLMLLASMYLNPDYKGKWVKKYLMINYKYITETEAVLSEKNAELFKKVINAYDML